MTPDRPLGDARSAISARSLAGRRARQHLSLVQDAEVRTVHLPASAPETTVRFELSPNDQHLAVHIVPNREADASNGYPVNAQTTDATTLFVNVATGEVRRSVLGFDATWP